MARKYFGTDGIRGRVGVPPMSPDFVLHLGWAIGRILARDVDQPKILVGKDTRQSGYMFESALEAGLSAAGVHVLLLGPQPTPAISYLTRELEGCAGIVVSASHNPHHDNGIKIFGADGFKLPDAIEEQIEEQLEQTLTLRPESLPGKANRIVDAGERYLKFCKSTVNPEFRIGGIKLLVDSAHGAGYLLAPQLFRELGAEVVTVGSDPDGININDGCGATSPEYAQSQARAHQADLALILDGDADRLLMVDEKGAIADGDDLLYVIARARLAQGKLHGGVVGTLMSNLGLEQALEQLGIPFARAAVGDRYVQEQLRERDWTIGGETSGHLICRDCSWSGCALITALQVLEALQILGASLSEIRAEINKYPQVMINVQCQNGRGIHQQTQTAVREAEEALGSSGRVLLRPSGTEPVLRVMVEGEDQTTIERLAQSIAKSIPV